jgi:hypothetical protein
MSPCAIVLTYGGRAQKSAKATTGTRKRSVNASNDLMLALKTGFRLLSRGDRSAIAEELANSLSAGKPKHLCDAVGALRKKDAARHYVCQMVCHGVRTSQFSINRGRGQFSW